MDIRELTVRLFTHCVGNHQYFPCRDVVSVSTGIDWYFVDSSIILHNYIRRLSILSLCLITFTVVLYSQDTTYSTYLVPPLMTHSSGAKHVQFSSNGRMIMALHQNNTISVRSVSSIYPMGSLPFGTSAEIRTATWHPLYKDTILVARGKTLLPYNFVYARTGTEYTDSKHTGVITAIAQHPTELILATVATDGLVCLWNLTEHKVQDVLIGSTTAELSSIAFTPDGERVVFASSDGIITTESWRQPGQNRLSWKTYDERTRTENRSIQSLSISPDGKVIVTGGVDRIIRLWQTETGTPMGVLPAHTNTILSMKFHPTKPWLYTSGLDSTLRMWEYTRGREISSAYSASALSSLDISQTGDTIVCAEQDTGIIRMICVSPSTASGQGTNPAPMPLGVYPLNIEFSSVTAAVGEIITVPLRIQNSVVREMLRNSTVSASVQVRLPHRLMDYLDTLSVIEQRGSEYDIVRVPLVFTSSDTIGSIRFRALMNENPTDSLYIVNDSSSLLWSEPVRTIRLSNTLGGSLSVTRECQYNQAVSFSQLHETSIYPQPATSEITVEFAAYETGHYSVYVYSILGDIALTLLDKPIERGIYSLSSEVNHLSTGAYIIRILAPSRQWSHSLYITR